MLPFFDLNDLILVKVLLCTKKKLTIKPTQGQQTDANVAIRNKMCNVCKKTSKIDKSFVCKTCQTPIHKKRLGLRLSEIRDIKNSKTGIYWECQTCMVINFHLLQ